jgi:type IV pilus assembly protein PilO
MNKLLRQLASLDGQKVLLAAAAVGAFYYFMVYNDGSVLAAEISTLRQQVQSENEKKKDTDAALGEERRMKQAVIILSEQYQLVSKKLPTQLTELEINGALESYARETRVRIKASRPGTPEKMEIVQEVPWEITLEGRFPEIMKFIQNVSSSERLTRLKSLVIGPVNTQEKSSSGLLKFEGVVVGYKLASEDPAKGPSK